MNAGLPQAYRIKSLLTQSDLADVVDESPRDIAKTLQEYPEQLPQPVRMRGVPYWPADLVHHWLTLGRPLHFRRNPLDFLPQAIASMTDGGDR